MNKHIANVTALCGFLVLVAVAALSVQAVAQGRGARAVGVRHDGNVHMPQFSPDGTRIAYEVNFPADKRTELYVVGWDGYKAIDRPERLIPESMSTTRRYGGGKRITHGFAWAPSGSHRYAYSVSDSTGTQDIYIDNWSTMVESAGSANKNPSWDPREARFVFSSGRTGSGDLYLWDPDEPEPMQLTFDEANAELYPIFNASGDKVVYVRQGKAGSHVFLLDVNFLSASPLVQYEGKESTRPCFNPDGSKISFFSNKATESATRFGLWVTDARPGSTPRNIAPRAILPSKGCAPWTPDGKGVVAAKDAPDEGDPICIFPVDGGSPNCLAALGTRNNRDPQLIVISGQWRLLYTAQVNRSDSEATWQEMYVYDIPR